MLFRQAASDKDATKSNGPEILSVGIPIDLQPNSRKTPAPPCPPLCAWWLKAAVPRWRGDHRTASRGHCRVCHGPVAVARSAVIACLGTQKAVGGSFEACAHCSAARDPRFEDVYVAGLRATGGRCSGKDKVEPLGMRHCGYWCSFYTMVFLEGISLSYQLAVYGSIILRRVRLLQRDTLLKRCCAVDQCQSDESDLQRPHRPTVGVVQCLQVARL